MKAELYALKSFVMEEIFNINKSLDRVKAKCNNTQCKSNMGAELQTKTYIIKTLLESFSNNENLSYTLYKAISNQYLAKYF